MQVWLRNPYHLTFRQRSETQTRPAILELVEWLFEHISRVALWYPIISGDADVFSEFRMVLISLSVYLTIR